MRGIILRGSSLRGVIVRVVFVASGFGFAGFGDLDWRQNGVQRLDFFWRLWRVILVKVKNLWLLN